MAVTFIGIKATTVFAPLGLPRNMARRYIARVICRCCAICIANGGAACTYPTRQVITRRARCVFLAGLLACGGGGAPHRCHTNGENKYAFHLFHLFTYCTYSFHRGLLMIAVACCNNLLLIPLRRMFRMILHMFRFRRCRWYLRGCMLSQPQYIQMDTPPQFLFVHLRNNNTRWPRFPDILQPPCTWRAPDLA